jgi:probable rRNA maturation factor
MAVLVSGTISARGIDRRVLGRKATIVLEALGLTESELSLSLVGDAEIRRLNRTYRGKDRPTDVLSFSLREGEFGGVGHALGDVVISLETAKRQGSENGLTLGDEVTRLLVHGILHLAGYDHEASLLEERRMKRKEREMLRRLAEWCMQEETASQRRSTRSKRRRKVLHALGR